MSQEVNFLKSIPKIQSQLPASRITLVIAACLALLVAISVYMAINQFMQRSQLNQVQLQHLAANAALQQVAKAYPLFASDKPLVEQVSDYEKMLREKEEKFKKLTHETLRKPFSSYLETLASVVPEGLWLATININQDSNNISLSGYSLQPISFSLLMQALQSSLAFTGVSFDLFYLRKLDDKGYMQFEIANDQLVEHKKMLEDEILKKKTPMAKGPG